MASVSDVEGLAGAAMKLADVGGLPVAPRTGHRSAFGVAQASKSVGQITFWEVCRRLGLQWSDTDAIDLFVDSVGGSDSNPGTLDAPKQTLASITWRPGLVVGLKRGSVFREVIDVNQANCALVAYGSGNPPVLIGSTAVTSGWANVSGNIYKRTEAASPSNFFERSAYTRTGITKLTKNTSTPTTPAAGEWGHSAGELYVYSTTDPNSKAYEKVTDGGTTGDQVKVSAAGVLLQDLSLFCAQRNGFYVTGAFDGFTARGVDTSYNTNDGGGGQPAGGNITGCLVEYCYSWANGYGPKDGLLADGDGYSWHGNTAEAHSEVTIRYSDIRYNTKSGIGCQDAVVVTAYGNYIEDSYNNIAIFGTTYTGPQAMVQTFAYNILVRSATEGTGVVIGGSAPSHAYEVRMYNNVIYSRSTSGFLFGVRIVESNLVTVVMRNNVIKGWPRGLGNFGSTNLDLDYNDLHGNTTNYFDNSTGYLTGKTGSHSITSDPLFVDAANGNFRLASGSPCVGAGVSVGQSLDNRRRAVGSTVDIGANQVSAA